MEGQQMGAPSPQQINKFFLKSKTVFGALLLLAPIIGITIPLGEGEFAQVVTALQEIVGIAFVVWGRLTAKQPLGFSLR